MKDFASLYLELDSTTKTNEKVAALKSYFERVNPAEAAWAIYFLTGRRLKQLIKVALLRTWACKLARLPDWLFDECYDNVGDLAETIALILPSVENRSKDPLNFWIEEKINKLKGATELTQHVIVSEAWHNLGDMERFLFNKLLTGAFRVGVSNQLVIKALAELSGVEARTISHRMMGEWHPDAAFFQMLISTETLDTELSRPYPFYLAHPINEAELSGLGEASNWLAEWKWDGIRGQMLQRPGLFALWSRGEELITDRFPEFALLAATLPPGTAMDGEVLAWAKGAPAPLPFASLQTRITRAKPGKAHLAAAPARFIAYDLLEEAGEDLRPLPLATRRARLERLIASLPAGMPIAVSTALDAPDWAGLAGARSAARGVGAEGLMLKELSAPYQAGRKRGAWWKWKLDPWSVDAVMLYAQAGHGRRAGLYSDFTFAVRDGEALVPFTKAYSGLTDAEFEEITRWVNRHTLERFGPVRRVPPELVFEIAFEGIQASPRHKSGVALRFPRMLRWRRDKPVAEIDTLETLRALLAAPGKG